ncbi:MAG: Nramp family divalent metal transporter, partial [Gemmatimonadaceae bacterium]
MATQLKSARKPEPFAPPAPGPPGWRRARTTPSLVEVYRTIPVSGKGGLWRKLLAFAGPGYLVAVGYMDPGNWATDIAGGSAFGYSLLSVILLANLMAIVLQALSARLGIASGYDLAQACRRFYAPAVSLPLWALCEIAIVACDLAEVLGTAIALKLLVGLPLLAGVILTALDVLAILALQRLGFRYIEAFVIALLAIIAVCFGLQLALAQPELSGVLAGFVPQWSIVADPGKLYIAIGILGATVMPHNLYLH